MNIQIPSHIITQITEHAQQTAPNECCGILFGYAQQIKNSQPIANTHKDPRKRYKMDPVQILKAMQTEQKKGNAIIAFYHSHTYTAAYPSKVDINDAIKNGWTEPYYIIISIAEAKTSIRAFKIAPNQTATEITITKQ